MKSSNLGYPRIGQNREWKKTLEDFWSGKIDEAIFEEKMQEIRLTHLQKQKDKGIDMIPVNDFTYYDHMLDMSVMFGLIPERFQYSGGRVPLSTYFSMARGNNSAVASEMTKWFNTNYHYIVPELDTIQPQLTVNKPLTAFREAKEKLGIKGKPVIVGPYTFLKLSKGYHPKQLPALILQIVPLYKQILQELEQEGVEWIQIDEPILVTSVTEDEMETVSYIYQQFHDAVPKLKIMLQTYFDSVDHFTKLTSLPVQGIGLDFVYGDKKNVENLQKNGFPEDKLLGVGMVDGRNIWRSNLNDCREFIDEIKKIVPENRLWIQPSSSLLHVPVTVREENHLAPEIKDALAFADEKLDEINTLVTSFTIRSLATTEVFIQNQNALTHLNASPARNRSNVQAAIETIQEYKTQRNSPYLVRKEKQKQVWNLPLLPTTTIGSFPQTLEVRQARRKFNLGEWSQAQYEAFINDQINKWITIQEEIGLDVLVHGEFERTDMVEFFGHKLSGFAFLKKGWVQSYGSRCVKPPVIYGDVEFLEPMTMKETLYAQSLTKKPVKGMLTGPVTILNWSFVRNDISREKVCNQLALALREEVIALESSGIKMIQVDEPALREGLPLKQEDRKNYLDWAVKSFLLTTSTVDDTTQIHTHMCYCDFNNFMDIISKMNADIISLETSRSHGELISSSDLSRYDKGIGLGVYDIHSPRIPGIEEMKGIIDRYLEVLDIQEVWINPDCGLKTRGDYETIESLKNMVKATAFVRDQLTVDVRD